MDVERAEGRENTGMMRAINLRGKPRLLVKRTRAYTGSTHWSLGGRGSSGRRIVANVIRRIRFKTKERGIPQGRVNP